jgi:hypothetical protein
MGAMRRASILCLALASSAHAVELDGESFSRAVRPMLQHAGCASASCHASGLIGMLLNAAGHDDAKDLIEVKREVRPGDPEHSALYRKALGIDHLGGHTVEKEGCGGLLLSAWIRGAKDLAPCAPPPRVDALPRVLDPLIASCATGACHGGPAAPRLLQPERPGSASVNAAGLARSVDRFLPSRSLLLRRLLGDRHPKILDGTDDPNYRRLFSWIADDDPVIATAGVPSYARFAHDVQPILVRRGCTDAACHGASGNPLVLVENPGFTFDNYLRIVARIADHRFPDKPRNLRAHGGGRRLGGLDDCAMAAVSGWLEDHPAPACTPRPAPDRARFAAVVQPSLEKLTCPRCHADPSLGFRFIAHPDAADLDRNYDEVLRKIDLDYPPASPVLMRVREDCMQARIMAWIDRAPDPGCVVDLRNFKGSFPSPTRTR